MQPGPRRLDALPLLARLLVGAAGQLVQQGANVHVAGERARRGALLAEPPQRRPRRGLLPDGRRPGQRHQRGGQPRARRPRRPAGRLVGGQRADLPEEVGGHGHGDRRLRGAARADELGARHHHLEAVRPPLRLAVAQHGQRVAEDPRGVPAGAAPREQRAQRLEAAARRVRDDFGPEALGGAARDRVEPRLDGPGGVDDTGGGAAAAGGQGRRGARDAPVRERVERREREHAARREGHRPLALPRGQHRTRDEHGGAERGRGVQRGVDALEEGRVRLCVEIPRLRAVAPRLCAIAWNTDTLVDFRTGGRVALAREFTHARDAVDGDERRPRRRRGDEPSERRARAAFRVVAAVVRRPAVRRADARPEAGDARLGESELRRGRRLARGEARGEPVQRGRVAPEQRPREHRDAREVPQAPEARLAEALVRRRRVRHFQSFAEVRQHLPERF